MGYGIDPALQNVQQIAGAFTGIAKNLKQFQLDKAADSYMAEMAKDPEYKPDYNDPEFNARAWNQARANQFDLMMKDEKFKKAHMESVSKSIETEYNQVTGHIRDAEGLVGIGDKKGAMMAYEKAYEQVRDGSDMTIDYDKNIITLKHPNGTSETIEGNNLDDLLGKARTFAKQYIKKDDFVQMALGEYFHRMEWNRNVMLNGQPFIGKNGEQGMRYVKMRDPQTGKMNEVTYEIDGQEVTEDAWKKLSMRKLDDAKKIADTQKARAGIKSEEALTKKRKAEAEAATAKGVTEKKGTLRKQVDTYIWAYGVDKETALDMIRRDKLSKEQLANIDNFMKERNIKPDRKTGKIPADKRRMLEEYIETVKAEGEEMVQTGKGKGARKVQAKDPVSALEAKYPAGEFKGKTATVNGVKYKSDGTTWKKQE